MCHIHMCPCFHTQEARCDPCTPACASFIHGPAQHHCMSMHAACSLPCRASSRRSVAMAEEQPRGCFRPAATLEAGKDRKTFPKNPRALPSPCQAHSNLAKAGQTCCRPFIYKYMASSLMQNRYIHLHTYIHIDTSIYVAASTNIHTCM